MPALDAGVKFKHQTSTGTVLTGNGKLYGLTVKITTGGGSAKLWDNTSAATTVIEDITMAAADTIAIEYGRPIDFAVGLHIVLTNAVATLRYMDGAYV